MNFFDLKSIENTILTVKEMNVLNNHSKEILSKAKKGFIWNCEKGHINIARWLFSLGGVNIHADNEYAFRKSDSDILKWLNILKN